MTHRSNLAVIAASLMLPLVLGCTVFSRLSSSIRQDPWKGKSFSARWSEPIPGGPLNFDGTISGCGSEYDIAATARVHGPLGGGADIDMKGKYPPDPADPDMVPIAPLAPPDASAVPSHIRSFVFDLPLDGEITGLRCPCDIRQYLHLKVEVDIKVRNAWIRQAEAPTGGGLCSCDQGDLLEKLVPVKYPDDVIIELAVTDDPRCGGLD